MTAKHLTRTSSTPTLRPLLLLAAFAGCENGGELEPPESTLGREIIEAFAAHVGEDPSDIRVREGAWTELLPGYPEVAEAIEAYVGEAGIAYAAWPGLPESAVFMPHVPRVIHAFWYWWWDPRGQRGLPGIAIGHGGVSPGCVHNMQLDPVEGGGWRVGELDKDCSGISFGRWRLEDGKWVMDGKWTRDGVKLVMDPHQGVIRMEDPR